jgi:hypothetical protein
MLRRMSSLTSLTSQKDTAVTQLRAVLSSLNLDAFLIPSSDAHGSVSLHLLFLLTLTATLSYDIVLTLHPSSNDITCTVFSFLSSLT